MISMLSCKSDGTGINSGINQSSALSAARTAYNDAPTIQTANSMVIELTKQLRTPDLSNDQKNKIIEEAIEVCSKHNLNNRKASFLFPYIKNNSNLAEPEKHIFDLATILKSANKTAAANTMLKGIVDNYPNSSYAKNASEELSEEIDNIDTYILTLGSSIFENPDITSVNRQSSLAYVDACEAYALVYPNKTETPANLFKAAEIAKTIKTFPKALSLYDWMIEKYPSHEKTPTAMFLKGFIIENNLGNDSLALDSYKKFIATFPDHDLADDAKFLIDNIGKTDEQILEMIESKRDQKEQ